MSVLLKPPTWRLSDVITPDFNLDGWLWWRPCVHRNCMTTYVRAPLRVLSNIHSINSYLRRHFLICGHGIRPYVVPFLSADYVCIRLVNLFLFFLSLNAVETFFCTIFLCLHVVSFPVSFCLHAGFDSFSSCLHVGINFFLIWPNLNNIYNNSGMFHKILVKICVIYACITGKYPHFVIRWGGGGYSSQYA